MDSDLVPARRKRYYELLHAQSPAQRLRRASELSVAVRRMAEIGLRRRYPNASAEELRVRLAARLHGRAAALRIHHWVPDDAR